MLSIGDNIKFVDEFEVEYDGKLTEVLSDAHDDVRLEDGVVRAEVVIFGKTNTVTLESSEYRETSKPPSK